VDLRHSIQIVVVYVIAIINVGGAEKYIVTYRKRIQGQ